ncbi:MAG: hypothetical protein Q9162_000291 [Coniocarpon cinnabarinum]
MVASRITAPRTLNDIIQSPEQQRDSDMGKRAITLAEQALKLAHEDMVVPSTASVMPPDVDLITSSHLLISPLLPPVAGMVAPFSGASFLATNMNEYKELATHPTIAIWGSRDDFTADKRLRKWAHALRTQSPSGTSGFEYVSIDRAGHFWREEGALDQLRSAIEEWVGRLDRQPDNTHEPSSLAVKAPDHSPGTDTNLSADSVGGIDATAVAPPNNAASQAAAVQ